MRHLVIGNGPAGVVAAEALRRLDPSGSVMLAGDEPGPAYSRMAIPYLLMGNIDEAGTHLRKDPAHFERLGIGVFNERVASVDAAAGVARLGDGRNLAFDRALLATGSRAIAAPIPGIESPHVHACWTLEDARAIRARARPGSRVALMGAGFIGCIIMEALASMGVKLTVVEMGNRMVPRMMGEKAGTLIRHWCESKGVRVLTSTKVESIAAARAGALTLALSDGSRLEADLVIRATGVRPNVELAKSAGIVTDVGVRVDEGMRTSAPNVFAAGDVAQAHEFYTRNYVVNAVQPNAADQALVAAANMAGRTVKSQGTIAINVLDTLGLIAASFGQWQGVAGGSCSEHVDEARYRYVSLQFDERERLVGATTLGLTEHLGVLRGLIQSRRPLGPWKRSLERDPLDLMRAYLATSQAAA